MSAFSLFHFLLLFLMDFLSLLTPSSFCPCLLNQGMNLMASMLELENSVGPNT